MTGELSDGFEFVRLAVIPENAMSIFVLRGKWATYKNILEVKKAL